MLRYATCSMYSRLRFAAQMLLLLVPNICPTPLLTGLSTKNAQFQVASIDSAGRGHSILDGQIILVKKHLSVMLLPSHSQGFPMSSKYSGLMKCPSRFIIRSVSTSREPLI
ncbi:hypothetical protein BD769DRAFT_549591 [Suillus cothurnatus]|nr:hypothetical protein BD769DRAFT_549591 [Suillus cothurnatus]